MSNEQIEELTKIFCSIFGMKYNGEEICTNEEVPLFLDASFRPDRYKDDNMEMVIWSLISEKIKDTDYKISEYNAKSNRHGNLTALQEVWLLEKGEDKFIVPILFKWLRCNHVIIELFVQKVTDAELFNWACFGLTDHWFNVNYSKIAYDEVYIEIPEKETTIHGLMSNQIVDKYTVLGEIDEG